MSIYERRADAPPDSMYDTGELSHLVANNPGRVRDPRRTPVTVVDVRESSAEFVVRIDDFEDKGAEWLVPFENVWHYQFERGVPRASDDRVTRFKDAVERFDKPLTVPCDEAARDRTHERLIDEREHAGRWLDQHATFNEARLPGPGSRVGDPRLAADLLAWMQYRDLSDLERQFAAQYVSNPTSGDLVKGHRIVMAELGLVPYEGKVPRDPEIFAAPTTRERRTDHILARMAFVHAAFTRLGLSTVMLYRGMSTTEPLDAARNHTFVSATFSREVAMSHFDAQHPDNETPTRTLLAQSVPLHRLFMTYHETAEMNAQFKEAEALLLHDPTARVF